MPLHSQGGSHSPCSLDCWGGVTYTDSVNVNTGLQGKVIMDDIVDIADVNPKSDSGIG